VVQTSELPPLGEQVLFDVHDHGVSVWSGAGSIYVVPLDDRSRRLLADPVRKITYDAKNVMLQLLRRGLELALHLKTPS
jgi:hypothetical protein